MYISYSETLHSLKSVENRDNCSNIFDLQDFMLNEITQAEKNNFTKLLGPKMLTHKQEIIVIGLNKV